MKAVQLTNDQGTFHLIVVVVVVSPFDMAIFFFLRLGVDLKKVEHGSCGKEGHLNILLRKHHFHYSQNKLTAVM